MPPGAFLGALLTVSTEWSLSQEGPKPDAEECGAAANQYLHVHRTYVFFTLSLQLALVRVGEAILKIPHVLIGNLVGRIAVEGVAGRQERHFHDSCILHATGYIPTGWDW